MCQLPKEMAPEGWRWVPHPPSDPPPTPPPPHHHLSLHRRLTQLSIGVWVQEGCGRGSGGSRGVSGGGSSILDGYERFPLHPTPRSRSARL